MPSRNEADPSVLLALAVPLMFGYMFGDVGQGLVIAAAAFAVRKRYPIARLFIAGGLAAVVFGILFGSVFSLHHTFPALWIDPLDDPLAILLVPLAGGAALLTIGLALNALEAWWRGEFVAWLTTDAGYVVAYLGILAGFVNPAGFVAAAAGALVFCVGHAVHAAPRHRGADRDRGARRAAAADSHQHAVVRARRRVRAGARRVVVGDRRADGRQRQRRRRRRSCSSPATWSCWCSK